MDKPGETDHNGSSRSVQKDGVYRAIIDPTTQSAFLDRRKTRVKSDVLSKTTNTKFQMRSVLDIEPSYHINRNIMEINDPGDHVSSKLWYVLSVSSYEISD